MGIKLDPPTGFVYYAQWFSLYLNKLPTFKIGSIHIKTQVSMVSWKTRISDGFELPFPQGSDEWRGSIIALWAGLCALCMGLWSACFSGSHFISAPQGVWVCNTWDPHHQGPISSDLIEVFYMLTWPLYFQRAGKQSLPLWSHTVATVGVGLS